MFHKCDCVNFLKSRQVGKHSFAKALERDRVGTGREGKANLDTEKRKSQLSLGKSEEMSFPTFLDNL